MKTFFLVRYCDKKCQYPKNRYCFTLSRHSRFRCVKCEVKELTEKWVCDECQAVKRGFDEYYELPEVPSVQSKLAGTMIRVPYYNSHPETL